MRAIKHTHTGDKFRFIWKGKRFWECACEVLIDEDNKVYSQCKLLAEQGRVCYCRKCKEKGKPVIGKCKVCGRDLKQKREVCIVCLKKIIP